MLLTWLRPLRRCLHRLWHFGRLNMQMRPSCSAALLYYLKSRQWHGMVLQALAFIVVHDRGFEIWMTKNGGEAISVKERWEKPSVTLHSRRSIHSTPPIIKWCVLCSRSLDLSHTHTTYLLHRSHKHRTKEGNLKLSPKTIVLPHYFSSSSHNIWNHAIQHEPGRVAIIDNSCILHPRTIPSDSTVQTFNDA